MEVARQELLRDPKGAGVGIATYWGAGGREETRLEKTEMVIWQGLLLPWRCALLPGLGPFNLRVLQHEAQLTPHKSRTAGGPQRGRIQPHRPRKGLAVPAAFPSTMPYSQPRRRAGPALRWPLARAGTSCVDAHPAGEERDERSRPAGPAGSCAPRHTGTGGSASEPAQAGLHAEKDKEKRDAKRGEGAARVPVKMPPLPAAPPPPARPPPAGPALASPQGRLCGLRTPRAARPNRAEPCVRRGRRASRRRSVPRRCHASGQRRGGAGSAPSSVLQRAPAWLGVRTAPAAGGGAGGAAANGSRGAAHVRAGPGRPRPLAPRAAAALRCPRAGGGGGTRRGWAELPGRVCGARRERSPGRQSPCSVLGAQVTGRRCVSQIKQRQVQIAWLNY